MASFGREQHEDDFIDQQQPDQGGGRFMPDDDGFPDQQQPDDHQHLDQGDPFMASLMAAIRSFTHEGFQGPDGSYSDRYYISDLAGGGDHFAEDDDEDEDEGDAYEDGYDHDHYSFPMLPAAASEAAIAALEAAEAPADDCCAVCLLQAGADDHGAWSRLAPCGHRFHAACVGEWLRVKLSCPVCRRPSADAAGAPAPASACRDAAAAEPPRPVPSIVNEMLAMSLDESLMFENSSQWLAFFDDPYGFSAGNSS